MYEDFAEFGLGWAASKFSLTPLIALRASDHSLLLAAPGVASAVEAWNEFEYGKSNGGSAVHTYVRFEVDFCANQIKVFAGPDNQAPLRLSVSDSSGSGARKMGWLERRRRPTLDGMAEHRHFKRHFSFTKSHLQNG